MTGLKKGRRFVSEDEGKSRIGRVVVHSGSIRGGGPQR